MRNQCLNLPEPVKKYFNLVLPNNPSLIKKVRLNHNGFFKTSPQSDWVKIQGKQYFKTEVPEFEWIGRTKLFKATDSFMNGKGRLKVKLLGVIPIVNAKGSEIDQAELLRWLGESVLFPTNLLPGNGISWHPLDMDHARLNYRFRDLDISYTVTFNYNGEISKIEALRYREKEKLERWVGKTSDYMDFNGYMVPSHIEASWFIGKEEFRYVDFRVKTIKYIF